MCPAHLYGAVCVVPQNKLRVPLIRSTLHQDLQWVLLVEHAASCQKGLGRVKVLGAIYIILALNRSTDSFHPPHISHDTPPTSHHTPHSSHHTPPTSHHTPHSSHHTPHSSHLPPHPSHLPPHPSHLPLTVSFVLFKEGKLVGMVSDTELLQQN